MAQNLYSRRALDSFDGYLEDSAHGHAGACPSLASAWTLILTCGVDLAVFRAFVFRAMGFFGRRSDGDQSGLSDGLLRRARVALRAHRLGFRTGGTV